MVFFVELRNIPKSEVFLHCIKVLSRWFPAGLAAVLLSFSFQLTSFAANPVKKTYLLIRQGNLAEARIQFDKAVKKGKNDFGMDYVFSHFFLSPYRKSLSLDSAYLYCLSAIDKYKKESIQGKNRYQKLNIEHLRIDSAELFSRKDYLDSLGFSKAQNLESESAYQWFLDHFPQSSRSEKAHERQASIAFARAQQENSHQAFEKFLEKYPDAGQAAEAREIRELMLYQNTAKKGHLKDWESFIEKNPNNRYLLKAQEKVYHISTKQHKAATYYDFIRKYPSNPNVSKAWEWIYYLEGSSLKELLKKYPDFPQARFSEREPIRNLQLIPVTDRGKFGWMDIKGRSVIKPRFDSIPEESRCEASSIRFLKAYNRRKVAVFSQDSFAVSEGEFDDAEWFQNGLIKVWRDGKQGLFHMGGYPILEPRYEQIDRISNGLLVIRQGEKKFLFSMKGNSIVLPGLDDVSAAGSYLALRSGKKYALIKESEVLQSIDNDTINPLYRYREMERFGENRLVLYEDAAAYFISQDNITILKIGQRASIQPCPWGVLLSESGIEVIVDSTGNRISGDYEKIRIEGNIAIVKKAGMFGLINRSGKMLSELKYDSLDLFTGGLFVGWKKNRRSILFESGKEVSYSGTQSPDLLRPSGTTSATRPDWFVVLTDSLGQKAVFSMQGKKLLPFAYSQINLLDDHWFAIQADKKFGLADTSGKVILKPSFSGISPINREFVCLSKGKNFSLYNPLTQKTLLNNLSSVARRFGNSKNHFIVRLNDKAGIIDQQGKQVVPCAYEDILYWSPGKCMVKRDGFWFGFMLASGKELVKPIKKIRLISDKDGEQIYEIESDGKTGIESTLRGELAATVHDQIVPFDLQTGICFFLGSRVQQSSVFNLIYIDGHGTPFKTQYLTEEEYEGILCD